MSLIHIGFDHLPGVGVSDQQSQFNHAITRINNKYRISKIKVQSTKSHVEMGGGRVKLFRVPLSDTRVLLSRQNLILVLMKFIVSGYLS